MVKVKHIVIIAVLLFSVLVCGCADKAETEDEVVTNDTEQEISVADELLNEEMIGITDTEIQDLEADLAELEALLNEISVDEEIVDEDI